MRVQGVGQPFLMAPTKVWRCSSRIKNRDCPPPEGETEETVGESKRDEEWCWSWLKGSILVYGLVSSAGETPADPLRSPRDPLRGAALAAGPAARNARQKYFEMRVTP
ncbi:hypothetical protein C8F04DRAFT_1181495 [Mycena alexandri]|uniref:Uncharacterized protein n=1 Tax=Mycena alexandri TaxID=1745969 RepID=A0AAD6X281_9AGAR|nr:hypothetical protein C8F04DRAFT_1181495 [Mycena alexandri]